MLWCVTGNGRLRIFWNTRQNATGVNRTGGGGMHGVGRAGNGTL